MTWAQSCALFPTGAGGDACGLAPADEIAVRAGRAGRRKEGRGQFRLPQEWHSSESSAAGAAWRGGAHGAVAAAELDHDLRPVGLARRRHRPARLRKRPCSADRAALAQSCPPGASRSREGRRMCWREDRADNMRDGGRWSRRPPPTRGEVITLTNCPGRTPPEGPVSTHPAYRIPSDCGTTCKAAWAPPRGPHRGVALLGPLPQRLLDRQAVDDRSLPAPAVGSPSCCFAWGNVTNIV